MGIVPARARRQDREVVAGGPRRSPAPRLTLLGGFGLAIGRTDVPLPMSAQRLVAFLALHDRPVLRVYVAGSLWPETTDERAGANLRSALWRLGPTGGLVVDARNGHLSLADVQVDLRQSRDVARRLLRPSHEPDVDHAADVAFATDLLPDWSDEWVIVEREHFRQLRLHALESLCARLTHLGRFPEAIEAGLAAVAAEPLRESAHRTLIKTHLAEGNVGEATHQYEIFRRILHTELGLKPSSAIKSLLRGLVALAWLAVASAPVVEAAPVV
jgi:DNA-binding SARP family transcriptional activator